MSLADGNNFNAKCHLLMIAPFAAAASKKTLGSFLGPDSDQTVLYIPLPPLFPQLYISGQSWAPPSASPGLLLAKGRMAMGSTPRMAFHWTSVTPLPSDPWVGARGSCSIHFKPGPGVRGPPQGSHRTQCIPCHYIPFCMGVPLSPLSSPDSKLQ